MLSSDQRFKQSDNKASAIYPPISTIISKDVTVNAQVFKSKTSPTIGLTAELPEIPPESAFPKLVEVNRQDVLLTNSLEARDVLHQGSMLEATIIPSTLKNSDGSTKNNELLEKFNEEALRLKTKSAFTTSGTKVPFRESWYLNPGEVLLGHRNKIPEMIAFNKDKYFLRDISRPSDTTEINPTRYKINEPFYGIQNCYVLNVPMGKYAIALSGNIPKIYDTGPHVIRDNNFVFKKEIGFIDKTELYIQHENLHIVRVPIGKIAKIWINNKPFLLESKAEPYVFNEQFFKIEKNGNNHLFDATANFIQHGPISVVRVPIGKFAKIWLNNKPFLLESKPEPYYFNDPLLHFDAISNEYFCNANANVIHHGTIHLIRVPAGKIAKIWLNNTPYILEARTEPYVINNPQFRIEQNDQSDFFDSTANNIQHGPLHIIRVPVGKVAKVWLNNKPIILEFRNEPYIFNDAQFRLEANGKDHLFDVTDNVISHGPLHIIRIPTGKLAKVWLNNQPLLLAYRETPYIFNNAQFRIEANSLNDYLFDATANVISHGTTHIVRVPSGKIAKVTVDNIPYLLEARPEPYEFDSMLFKIEKNKNGSDFFDATDQLIIHGAKKRIIPHTGEVAITYNGGTLEVLDPQLDNRPILIDSASHEVTGLLNLNVRTIEFPCKEEREAKAKLRAEIEKNPKITQDDINLVFTTMDQVSVGVILAVSFDIPEPKKALANLKSNEDILKHIETLAKTDMSKAIQQCTSQKFLAAFQNQPKLPESVTAKQLQELLADKNSNFKDNKKEESQETIIDKVNKQLAEHLSQYGIHLICLRIETVKMLDQELAKEMSKQALSTAATSTQEAMMDQKYRIAQREAEQAAEAKRIAVEQANQAVISKAEAELKAAELYAKAIIVKAEGDKKAAVLKAEGEKQAAILLGEPFVANRLLYDLEVLKYTTKMYAAALEKLQLIPQLPPGVFGPTGSPFTLFNSLPQLRALSDTQQQTLEVKIPTPLPHQ